MLREAVESVLRQTYTEYELIVVDDGSEDETVARLGAYGSAVRVVLQRRRGVSAARNLGVSWARGELLAFLDSDDWWHPRKLEAQTAFMVQHPEMKICQSAEVWIRRGVRVNAKKKHAKPSGDIFRACLDLCVVSPSTVMMQRRLFDRVGGFDEALPVCEDYDLWLRIAKDTPVFLLDRALATKRGGHEDQLSRSTWGIDRFRMIAILKVLESGLNPEQTRWALEALAKKVTILAQGARKRGDHEAAAVFEQQLSRARQKYGT
jgi:glycosyltransferase involved in cell wall biosynthesis